MAKLEELTRKSDETKTDIDDLYELLGEVLQTTTGIRDSTDRLHGRVDGIETRLTGLSSAQAEQWKRFDSFDRQLRSTGVDLTRMRNRAGDHTLELDDIEARQGAHDRRFDAVEERLTSHDEEFAQIGRKLAAHDERFDEVDARFGAVERRFDGVDKRFEVVDSKLDTIIEKLDGPRMN